jgi:hypothetical protein
MNRIEDRDDGVVELGVASAVTQGASIPNPSDDAHGFLPVLGLSDD